MRGPELSQKKEKQHGGGCYGRRGHSTRFALVSAWALTPTGPSVCPIKEHQPALSLQRKPWLETHLDYRRQEFLESLGSVSALIQACAKVHAESKWPLDGLMALSPASTTGGGNSHTPGETSAAEASRRARRLWNSASIIISRPSPGVSHSPPQPRASPSAVWTGSSWRGEQRRWQTQPAVALLFVIPEGSRLATTSPSSSLILVCASELRLGHETVN